MRAKDRLELAPALLGSNCAYRRQPLMACGGFRDGALSEDSDLTVTFYREGYRVRFMEDAVSYQQVPQSLDGYIKQHIRWGRGLNDVARVHSFGSLPRPSITFGSAVGVAPVYRRLSGSPCINERGSFSELFLSSWKYPGCLALDHSVLSGYASDPNHYPVLEGTDECRNVAPAAVDSSLFLLDIFAAIRSMLDTVLKSTALMDKNTKKRNSLT